MLDGPRYRVVERLRDGLTILATPLVDDFALFVSDGHFIRDLDTDYLDGSAGFILVRGDPPQLPAYSRKDVLLRT